MQTLICLCIGMSAGILSGLLGIGGGIIIVPALIYLLDFNQHLAQGTTLALMVPPIGLLAAITYFNKGYVNIYVAAIICIGFFIGGLFGAKIAMPINDLILRKMFGIFMLIVSIHLIWR